MVRLTVKINSLNNSITDTGLSTALQYIKPGEKPFKKSNLITKTESFIARIRNH